MIKKSKKLLSIILVLFAMFSLVACTSNSTPETLETPEAQDKQEPEEATEQSANSFPFELTTDNDAVVTFTRVPESVIAANPNAGEQLMAMGLGDKIIATSYNNALVSEEFREEYESKPSLTETGQPTLEVVLDLNPDFIYGRSSAFGEKGISDHGTLTEYGIMSLSSIEGYKLGADVEDVYQDFYNLGRIFELEDRAEQIVEEMTTKINAVEEKLAGTKPIKVFNFDAEREGGAFTPGNNFTSKLIRRAGGINVFEDLEKTWNTVSWEAVVESEPDIIVINDYGSTPIQEKIELLKTHPALSGLKAVQEENFLVITLPEVFASARVAGTIEKFAKAFHPELY